MSWRPVRTLGKVLSWSSFLGVSWPLHFHIQGWVPTSYWIPFTPSGCSPKQIPSPKCFFCFSFPTSTLHCSIRSWGWLSCTARSLQVLRPHGKICFLPMAAETPLSVTDTLIWERASLRIQGHMSLLEAPQHFCWRCSFRNLHHTADYNHGGIVWISNTHHCNFLLVCFDFFSKKVITVCSSF